MDKKRHISQRGIRGWTNTPSAAKRNQGVDKNAICCKEGSGGGQKRHLLQMEIREWTTNDICCKGGSGGGQNTPSAAKGGQGVDKKFHLLHWSIRGGGQKRHLLQRGRGVDQIRKEEGRWTKNAICSKWRSGSGQKRHLLQIGTKTPSVAKGDLGSDKKTIC